MSRFRRQVTLPGFGVAGQAALARAHVAVVGAGGLGSPALLYLAAAGVGTVTVVDDDTVELSNLHRQVVHRQDAVGEPKVASARATMHAINTDVTVRTVAARLTDDTACDILTGADVVIDGTDNFEARHAVSRACAVLGVPHVWGSVLGFDAQMSVFHAGHGPVYEDVFPAPPAPGSVPSCAEAGVLGPLVGTVGTAMALEAVKVVTGVGEPLRGVVAYLTGLTGRWEYIPVVADPAVAEALRGRGTTPPSASPASPPTVTAASETASAPAADADAAAPDPTADPRDDPAADAGTDPAGATDLIDVREPGEYEAFHIPGARNVPVSVLDAAEREGGGPAVVRAAGLAAPEDAPAATQPDTPAPAATRSVLVYCLSGSRSARVAAMLTAAGVPGVRDYPGGITAWLDRRTGRGR
ncbi:molybdopterin biosynthesis protein MoeB [Corynebacterium bovis]|uniref:Molybdopterin biosynthesis protein MoeB n=1 Tax=Corynebacterium bovis TaxID=36808 RepID=A0A3R8PLA0_9CORY|nr:molybdopterin biosynthesis protein MoeB [Corynebacterium bovis]RRQ00643.1 molybdopterin biosynthesis protein MoeB [Corynebacterium bovis]RRQ01766.1 molybdopterin biosynthesis protein MoeB [Corynebacterium bovis]RRQ04156.1 molybdopterin biosynthesis protein MoeB [Corynebacterium bovis]RRQ06884.1 molybdopterin biosynthesis protein MoeB [Corynebacterium bovis]